MVTAVASSIKLHFVLGHEINVILHSSIYSLTQAKIKLMQGNHIEHNHCSSISLSSERITRLRFAG